MAANKDSRRGRMTSMGDMREKLVSHNARMGNIEKRIGARIVELIPLLIILNLNFISSL
jgi:hypothetical protein